MPLVHVRALSKSFRRIVPEPGWWGALRSFVAPTVERIQGIADLSFDIPAGSMVGCIGPNGAGKSTSIKILSGILVPDSGECRVAGRVPWTDRIAHVRTIGVVFGQRTQLQWDLPVSESFDLLREIYEVEAHAYRRTREELIDRLDLGGFLHAPVRQLSLGQRMRADLAAALLHQPELLFLDEPTIGLDAPSKLALREFIRAMNRDRGTTVLLTTHDLDDVEALCPRILVIAGGTLLADSSLVALRERVSAERHLQLDLEHPVAHEVSDPEARVVSAQAGRVVLAFDPSRVAGAQLIQRVTTRWPVRDLFMENAPIEEVIARLYEQGTTM